MSPHPAGGVDQQRVEVALAMAAGLLGVVDQGHGQDLERELGLAP